MGRGERGFIWHYLPTANTPTAPRPLMFNSGSLHLCLRVLSSPGFSLSNVVQHHAGFLFTLCQRASSKLLYCKETNQQVGGETSSSPVAVMKDVILISATLETFLALLQQSAEQKMEVKTILKTPCLDEMCIYITVSVISKTLCQSICKRRVQLPSLRPQLHLPIYIFPESS